MTPQEKRILKSMVAAIEKMQVGTEPLTDAISQYQNFLRAIELRLLVEQMKSAKS